MRSELSIAAIVGAFGLCGQLSAAPNTSPIRIGLLLPPEETEARSLRQGAGVAIEWANRPVPDSAELIVRGRSGQWGDDGVEAGRMVLDDGVVGLVAPPGGMPTHLALQVAGRTATPVVSMCADRSVTGAGVPWSIRIVPRTTDEARTIMGGLGTPRTRWAALVPGERAGREITRDLSEAAATVGCDLNSFIGVDHALTDFSTLASRLPDPWPDGLLIWLEPGSAALAVRHLVTAGFRGTMAGPGRLQTRRFLEDAGSALDGFVLVGPKGDPGSMRLAAQFEIDYRKNFSESPDPSAMMAHDAVSLLIRLAREAGLGAVHRQFPIQGEFEGITGPMAFDREGNRLLPLELSRFRDGRWSRVEDVGNHDPRR